MNLAYAFFPSSLRYHFPLLFYQPAGLNGTYGRKANHVPISLNSGMYWIVALLEVCRRNRFLHCGVSAFSFVLETVSTIFFCVFTLALRPAFIRLPATFKFGMLVSETAVFMRVEIYSLARMANNRKPKGGGEEVAPVNPKLHEAGIEQCLTVADIAQKLNLATIQCAASSSTRRG